MNAEKFDIEKLIEADAESIEIDLDFKAKLKANIMKNNSSFENDNIIEFNGNTSRENVNKSKDSQLYRKYLKIASSFAIVGLIGFRVGVGGLGIAKIDKPNDIQVLETKVYTVTGNNEAASANNINNPSNEGKIDEVVKEEAKPSENIGANTDKVNKRSESKRADKVEDTTPATENGTDYMASVDGDSDNELTKSDNPSPETEYDNGGKVEKIEPTTELDYDDLIKKQDDSHYASANDESNIKDEFMLVSYGKENGLDLYYQTLGITIDEEFIIQDNKVYSKNGDLEEVIFTQEDNYQLIGIKKINDNEILLYKGLLGNQENKTYQLSKFNISSKNENLLVVEANGILVNNTYDKLAFEFNSNIVIKDIKMEKQDKVLNGKNIAWSPDGQYLSFVRMVQKEEEGKVKTYSSLVVYNCKENEEKTLAENELIVKNDDELIGRYDYGENLWSNDNKSIYVVRDDHNVMRDTDGNKKQVINLIFKK